MKNVEFTITVKRDNPAFEVVNRLAEQIAEALDLIPDEEEREKWKKEILRTIYELLEVKK